MSTVYAYCRVSTREQNLDRQLEAMRAFGVEENHIFSEKMSGKDFDRPVYRRLMKTLKRGDVLVIKSIDRLGRSYRDVQEQWRLLTKTREVSIVVLDMPLLDTRRDRTLVGMMIADLVLQILAYVAETEREFLRQRTREGMAVAKERGVRFGRQRMPLPENFSSVYGDWLCGAVSAREAARLLGVAHSTFLRWAREEQAAQLQQDPVTT